MDPRYLALRDRVDAFVGRVEARHRAELQCRPGCDGCCRTRLSVAAVEAAAIRAWLAGRPVDERQAIARAAATATADRCAALADDGRCRIYPARPLVCRSHGVPIRLRDGRGLPVVTACELNFTGRGPATADPDCVLDQELVSTTLGLVDRAACPDEPRVELAALLASTP